MATRSSRRNYEDKFETFTILIPNKGRFADHTTRIVLVSRHMLEVHSWESAAIKADGLKILLGVNPTFFAVNTDPDPDIRANAQIDSTL